jgi:uridylate kinase
MTKIISLGGSIVAPEKPDVPFIREFRAMIESNLKKDPELKLVFIVGGGGPARIWQDAGRQVSPEISHEKQDWIGIMATRLNAQLMACVFGDYCKDSVVTDPMADFSFTSQILVAAGWKPGFSTDFDAVMLAEKLGADTVINLSNIDKIFTDDPKKNPDAKPIDSIKWSAFRAMIGDEWVPGKNLPFDPIAAQKAQKLGLTVIAAGGRDLSNLQKIFDGIPFHGSTILPD